MPRVSAAFFCLAALCLLTGMTWGMWMASTENFVLAPAHAHLNLLGWVTMSIYGTFYALTRETMSPRLAWTNFIFAAAGVLIMIPTLSVYLMTSNQNLGPVIGIGGVLSILGLLTFGISAVRELTRSRTAA